MSYKDTPVHTYRACAYTCKTYTFVHVGMYLCNDNVHDSRVCHGVARPEDYYRYMAEFRGSDEAVAHAQEAYDEALDAVQDLACNPLRGRVS